MDKNAGIVTDFLYEWGWAVLIIMLMFGAMMYFEVFDPKYTEKDCVHFCGQRNMTCGIYTQNTVSCYPDLTAYYTRVFNWSTGEEVGFD